MLPNVFIGIGLYFLLALGVGGLLLLPWRRRSWSGWAASRWRLQWLAQDALRGWQSWRQRQGLRLQRHPLLLALALSLLALALPAAFWTLRQWHPPDTFDHRLQRPADPLVARLLQGENLVPPVPLPPALFAAAELRQARPLLGSANRDWSLLDPEFRQRLLLLMRLMQERHGVELVLIEGFRSPERQAALHALGPHVTQAAAGMSLHQRGLAADLAFLRGGRIVLDEREPWAMQAYRDMGQLAQSLGLVWGGAWRSLKDYGHLELRRAAD